MTGEAEMMGLVHVPNTGLLTLEGVRSIIDSIDVSINTRSQYKRDIRHFLDWLGTGFLYPNVLLDFKRSLECRSDIGTGTKAKYLTVSRVVLKELYRGQVIPIDVTIGVKSFRVTRTHKRNPIADDEVELVWTFLNSTETDPRTKVIIGLMYFQGFRRIEVSRLIVEDFDPSARTLMVWGKGRDDKELVHCHPRLVEILISYLNETGLRSGPLFPSTRSEKGLSSNMIWRKVNTVHRTLGIKTNVHGYRKVFTSKLIDSGMNLLDVRSFTRHKDLTQLQTYYDRLNHQKSLPRYYEVFDR
jgi:site-specific recombinase XerD